MIVIVRRLTMLLAVFTGACLISIAQSDNTHYFVDPDGDNSHSGLQPNRPFQTIQHALEQAQPGDTIHLTHETYYQDVDSVRSGRPDAPITITGVADTTIAGAGDDSYVVHLKHSHIHMESITINGRREDYGESSTAGYRNKLLYIYSGRADEGISGIQLRGMTFRNAGEECVRFRYFVTESEVSYSHFENCGIYDFELGSSGKVGEALYLGTSSRQWQRNPTVEPDETAHNYIHHNEFITRGNECIDLKEGTHSNIIAHNQCSQQQDPESGGISIRGDNNIIRYNHISDNQGAGIRTGGNTAGGTQYGLNNDIYGNIIYDNQQAAIKYEASPQGIMCGNNMWDNAGGNAGGSFAENFTPEATCEDPSVIQQAHS